tara:strand:- start:359 stop:553 length:195 start_codon:yes stop_codon:yes gene_type:complete
MAIERPLLDFNDSGRPDECLENGVTPPPTPSGGTADALYAVENARVVTRYPRVEPINDVFTVVT